ncbi:aspartate/glutamate racemase family protein [Rhodopseudomonas sp. P2A-2r]|uniref:aspartate/glutamate racemase family protein n=1 Tax=unclassified Rhodopseudomonas TaxID=2638247 RepID=UPI002233F23D|nr:aspartate/glutamate racemase family protein [Rhodopseudomonas sp. P2A-2r]UZE47198.1 aspartate/glutamate racemase family protein [Rhodopseudomonas sp. P2A-2r]
MRTIGLLGGMSWESTAVYYRRINETVRNRLGGLHSAEVILHSVNFEAIVALQKAGDWDQAGAVLAQIARNLEGAGADCVLICTNTMHKLADTVQDAISIPLLHITDVTGEAVKAAGCRRPLLLATRYTMEQDFYLSKLRDDHGLAPLVPNDEDRTAVHDVIFGELCCGIVSQASRQRYLDVIATAKAAGADSVILGCTEIGLLIGAKDFDLPAFDSTLIHADAAVAFALDQLDTRKRNAA